jgi:TonB family protein
MSGTGNGRYRAGRYSLGLFLAGTAAFAQMPDEEAPHAKPHLSAQAIQAIHLKGYMLTMQKATGSAKEATCLLSLWYAGDGAIQAVQLAKASGFPLIDQACLQAAIGRRFESLPDGDPGGRTFFTIHWVFNLEEGEHPQQVKIRSDPAIPQLPAGGAMHPLPHYPADALAQGAHGICKMHITVAASGAVSSIEITQSTGSGSLDEACKEAVYRSAFSPATSEGQPVSGSTDVAIDWRLPRL